ncbi:MAG TPA: hypothetical protein V6D25_15110 [Leptolyngbyaceae cyanobacterium]
MNIWIPRYSTAFFQLADFTLPIKNSHDEYDGYLRNGVINFLPRIAKVQAEQGFIGVRLHNLLATHWLLKALLSLNCDN